MGIKQNYKDTTEALTPWLKAIGMLGQLFLVIVTFGHFKMATEVKVATGMETDLNWSEREAIGEKLEEIATSSYSEELKALMSQALEARLEVLNSKIK